MFVGSRVRLCGLAATAAGIDLATLRVRDTSRIADDPLTCLVDLVRSDECEFVLIDTGAVHVPTGCDSYWVTRMIGSVRVAAAWTGTTCVFVTDEMSCDSLIARALDIYADERLDMRQTARDAVTITVIEIGDDEERVLGAPVVDPRSI